MTEIRLHEPVVRGNSVDFSWTISPDDGFYLDPRFTLEFPESVPVSEVPEDVWLRVMMVCLYVHWAVMRPCRVVLPRRLPEGELEFWRRMVDAGVWTLENDQDEVGGPTYAERTARAVEIVDSGPPAGEMTPAQQTDGVVGSFSSGRDSLTQTAMLAELGFRPLLVTTVSQRAGSIEFATPRFRMVLGEAQTRMGLELVEVKSDIRSCFLNDHPLVARYGLAASEVTDTTLYFAVCWATACARGASSIFLASEAELQESVRRDGLIVQREHFGFSSATQRAFSALTAPTGISYGGLTSSIDHHQIQRILDQRYTDLSELQYSCFSQLPGEDVCSNCFNCLKTSLHKMSDGTSPSDIAIDLNRVLAARSDWTPGNDGELRSSVGEITGKRQNEHLVRVLRGLDVDRVAQFAPGGELSPAAEAGLAQLRDTAFNAPDPPAEPGYLAGYLELLEEPLRSGMAEILSEHFEEAPLADYEHLLANTRMLSDWIAAPLAAGRLETEPGI